MMDTLLTELYRGGGLPYFSGSIRQGGSGFLGNLVKFALPILSTVGKHALHVASSTAQDVVDKHQPIGEALMKNTLKEIEQSTSSRKRQRPSEFDRLIHKQKNKRTRRR